MLQFIQILSEKTRKKEIALRTTNIPKDNIKKDVIKQDVKLYTGLQCFKNDVRRKPVKRRGWELYL
jgi:hypothetical protein